MNQESTFSIERLPCFQKCILKLAEDFGEVNPELISKHYDETYWTIKRNLNTLEQQGKLKRTHCRRLEFELN